MARTSFITHDERQIVFMNFAGIQTVEEALAAIREAKEFVAAQPRRRNLLTLVDVTDAMQDPKISDALQDLAELNKPYVLAGAVVGVNMLKRMLFRMVVMMSGRKLATFATLDDAKDWLVHQWVPPISVPDIARF
jgi:predicted dinucleotide-utilizing enzyme